MNRIVALDVDGVLTDFDAHWRQCAEHTLGRVIPRISEDHQLRVAACNPKRRARNQRAFSAQINCD